MNVNANWSDLLRGYEVENWNDNDDIFININ